MRSPTRVGGLPAVILCAVFGLTRAVALTPTQIWDQESRPSRLSADDARALPAELMPALRFQVLYGRIVSGEEMSKWRADLEAFANSTATDPVSSGIREAARVWLARAQMADLDPVLLEFYRHKVRYPKSDAEFQTLLPASLARDPWGQPWVYTPRAPQGFSQSMTGQRYGVAPTSLPGLLPLAEAVAKPHPVRLASTISARDLGGRRSLEFRSGNTVSVIQPGGKAESCVLLYVGDRWALMSGEGRLFTVRF